MSCLPGRHGIATYEFMADPRLRLASELAAVNRQQLLDALARPTVTVAVSNGAGPAARLAAVALYGLCCRVFPNVEFDGTGDLPPNPWGASTIDEALSLQPHAPPLVHSDPRRTVLVVGTSGAGDWFLGGDDWNVSLSRRPVTSSPNPIQHGGLGLQMAACLAFGEVFKQALNPLGFRSKPLDGEFLWNLVDYKLRHVVVEPPTPRRQRLLLAGAGSLASAAVSGLIMASAPAELHIIDDDSFDPVHNPYRYSAATTETNGFKASWLASICNTVRHLEATGYVQRIENWTAEQARPGFDGTALVTVDRVDGRRYGADLLARSTVSAGVDGLALQVHRSYALDEGQACSYCDYVDAADPADQVDVYASLTGIDKPRIQQLVNGVRLTEADLEAAVAAGKIPGSQRIGLVGRRLEDLVRAAYGEATVNISDTEDVARVSAPHVSWAAGMITAAELVKAGVGLPLLSRRVRLDLRGVPLGVTDRPLQEPTGRCLCHDPVRSDSARSWYLP